MRSLHHHLSSSPMWGMRASVCSTMHIPRLSPSPPCCVWVQCVLSSSPPTASHDLIISSSLLRCSFRSSRGFQTACSGAPRPPWLGYRGIWDPRTGQNCRRSRPQNDSGGSTTTNRQLVVRRPRRSWRRRRAHHGLRSLVPRGSSLQSKGNMAARGSRRVPRSRPSPAQSSPAGPFDCNDLFRRPSPFRPGAVATKEPRCKMLGRRSLLCAACF